MNDETYTLNDVELAYRQARALRAQFVRQFFVKLFTRKPAAKTATIPMGNHAHA